MIVTILALLCAVAMAGAGWLAAERFVSPEQRAAMAEPPPATPVTAAVARGTLARQVTANGSVEYAAPETLQLQSSASPAVVTSQMTGPGQSVAAGDVLLTVNGRPVVALPGAFPAYRDMRTGDTGLDVEQLQNALRTAGYTIRAGETGTFGAGTERAVRALYKDAGFEVQTVTASTQNPATDPAEVVEPSSALVVVPAGEVLFIRTLPATVVTVPPVGALLSSEQNTLTLTDGRLIARAQVAPSVAVDVTTDTVGTAQGVDGQSVDVLVSAVSGGDAATGAPVTLDLSPTGELPAQWSGTQFLLTLELQAVARDALLVPARAVSEAGDGTAHVMVLHDDVFELIPVRELGTLAGQSAVEPLDEDTLVEGDQVRVG